MKKVTRSIAAVALMFIMAESAAQETKVSVSPNTEKSLVLKMDAPSDDTVVSISDDKGVLMFTEISAGVNAYSKKFNLKNLPDGDYFLTVENLKKETVFEFDIKDSKTNLSEGKESIKPLFSQDGKKVFLKLLNANREAVKITVYDGQDRTVFKEELQDARLKKAFNFEKAYAGNYTVVVKTAGKLYSENILIK